MEFQQHLQYLEETGLINKYSNKEDELVKVKYTCNLD